MKLCPCFTFLEVSRGEKYCYPSERSFVRMFIGCCWAILPIISNVQTSTEKVDMMFEVSFFCSCGNKKPNIIFSIQFVCSWNGIVLNAMLFVKFSHFAIFVQRLVLLLRALWYWITDILIQLLQVAHRLDVGVFFVCNLYTTFGTTTIQQEK